MSLYISSPDLQYEIMMPMVCLWVYASVMYMSIYECMYVTMCSYFSCVFQVLRCFWRLFNILIPSFLSWLLSSTNCMYVYTCMYVCMLYVSTWMHVCMYVVCIYMNACMYVCNLCNYVCMYVHVCRHENSSHLSKPLLKSRIFIISFLDVM